MLNFSFNHLIPSLLSTSGTVFTFIENVIGTGFAGVVVAFLVGAELDEAVSDLPHPERIRAPPMITVKQV
ncbi:hypothetical protein D3C86_1860790 [compost metagenome]